MLQFSQALLYEENHFSPLSEMLIMRSLRNPYVVGQTFFWGLKANLYLKPSYERYQVLLEQLLMCSGGYIKELIVQSLINRGLQSVSECVTRKKEKKKDKQGMPYTMSDISIRAKEQLALVMDCMPCPFTVPIEPKFIAHEFKVKKLLVFSSAKSPLRVVCVNNDLGGDTLQVMFKNGDDLRQDILTLQMIDIMDRIWLDNHLDLAMTPYKVLPTNCMQGYLEFNLNAVTLADIQHKDKQSLLHTFTDSSVYDFFVTKIIGQTSLLEKRFNQFKGCKTIDEIKKKVPNKDDHVLKIFLEAFDAKMKKIRNVFNRSCAGYCVASYVLGLGDRHPDNIMINWKEGNFFHIDFGHFLEHKKKMPVVKISRE